MKKKLKFLNFKKVFNNKIVAGEIPVMTTVSLGAVPIAGAVSFFTGGQGNNSSSSTGGATSSGSSSAGSSAAAATSAVAAPAAAPAAPGGTPDAGGTGGCGPSNPGAIDVGIIAPVIFDPGPIPDLPPQFCWVAREVYGQNNIKWQLFRSWMLNQSPEWFLKLYIKHGESTASFLKNKTTLKNIIRIWMDYIISNKLKAEYNFAI